VTAVTSNFQNSTFKEVKKGKRSENGKNHLAGTDGAMDMKFGQ